MSSRIDLDDLPPRVAKALAALRDGDEVVLVQGGAVVARLTVAESAPPAAAGDSTPVEDMAEVMDHFKSMIDDEF